MNEVPHGHEPKLGMAIYDFRHWEVAYGDTHARLLPPPFGRVKPRRWMAVLATRRAIAKHDRGSIRAGKVKRKENELQAAVGSVVSDWYMDSPARMEDLHAEALRMNRSHARNRLPELNPSQFEVSSLIDSSIIPGDGRLMPQEEWLRKEMERQQERLRALVSTRYGGL